MVTKLVKKSEVDAKVKVAKPAAKKIAPTKKVVAAAAVATAVQKVSVKKGVSAKKVEQVKEAPAKKRPTPAAFLREFTPSKALAVIVGAKALTRAQVTKGVWDYIKKHKLQDAANKRIIKANAALKEVFGKAEVTMLEIAALVNKHLTAKVVK